MTLSKLSYIYNHNDNAGELLADVIAGTNATTRKYTRWVLVDQRTRI
jgi:hypothetical protein